MRAWPASSPGDDSWEVRRLQALATSLVEGISYGPIAARPSFQATVPPG